MIHFQSWVLPAQMILFCGLWEMLRIWNVIFRKKSFSKKKKQVYFVVLLDYIIKVLLGFLFSIKFCCGAFYLFISVKNCFSAKKEKDVSQKPYTFDQRKAKVLLKITTMLNCLASFKYFFCLFNHSRIGAACICTWWVISLP